MIHKIESLTVNTEKNFLVVVTYAEDTRWQWTVSVGTPLEVGAEINTLTLHELLEAEIFGSRKEDEARTNVSLLSNNQ